MTSPSVLNLCRLDRHVRSLLPPLGVLLFLVFSLLVFLSPTVSIVELFVPFFVTLHQLVVFSMAVQPEYVAALVAWAVLDLSLVGLVYLGSVRGFEQVLPHSIGHVLTVDYP